MSLPESIIESSEDLPLEEEEEEEEQSILSTEQEIVISFYYNLNKKLIDAMKCREPRIGMFLSCENFFDIMADLLLDYESRVKRLPDGCLHTYRLISPKIWIRRQLGYRFLYAKFARMHPELFEKKEFSKYTPKVFDNEDKYREFAELILSNEFITSLGLQKHRMKMKGLTIAEQNDKILQEIISTNLKKLHDQGEGIDIFYMDKDKKYKISRAQMETIKEERSDQQGAESFSESKKSAFKKKPKKKPKPSKKKPKPSKKKPKPSKKKPKPSKKKK